MKKQLFLSILAAGAAILSAASCQKDAPAAQVQEESGWNEERTQVAEDEGVLEITLSSPSMRAVKQTSVDALAENAINTVDIFVFNASTNAFEKKVSLTIANPSAPAPISVNLSAGSKKIYAYANYPSSIRSGMSSWTGAYSTHPHSGGTLGEFYANRSFPMRIATTATVVRGATTGCSLAFNRTVSRVRIVSITNNLPSSTALNVKGFFIANAVIVDSGVSGEFTASNKAHFCNRWGASDPENDPESFIDFSGYFPNYSVTENPRSFTVAGGSGWTLDGDSSVINSGCYAYPNTYSTDGTTLLVSPESWTARSSRIILVAEIAGQIFYYPYALPAMTANYTYDLSVTINQPGLIRPDAKWETGSYTAAIDIADWTTGATYTENF